MLEYYGCSDRFDEVCQWYDGYHFGNTRIFNSWSVISYISDHCEPKAFWQSTGSNDFIAEIISSSTPQLKEELYTLLNGEAITYYIDTGVVYPQIQNNPYLICSFLLMSGYLCVSKVYPQYDGNCMCDVAIPNKENAYVYEKEVLNQFKQNHIATSVTQAVFTGDTEKLQMLLNRFMLESVSSFDVGNESFYHGMMLGLCAVTGNRWHIRANRESGLGRFDIMLIPEDNSLPGLIYEFKHTKDERTDLNRLAKQALQQIEERHYDSELRFLGVKQIMKIGIAFCGKKAVVEKTS